MGGAVERCKEKYLFYLASMKKVKLIIIALRILLVCLLIFVSFEYLRYKGIILNEKPIYYSLVSKKEHKGGRGSYFTIAIKFRNNIYHVSATSKMFYQIEEGSLPNLYYSKTNDSVFSDWTIKILLRIWFLLLIVLTTTFFYYRK